MRQARLSGAESQVVSEALPGLGHVCRSRPEVYPVTAQLPIDDQREHVQHRRQEEHHGCRPVDNASHRPPRFPTQHRLGPPLFGILELESGPGQHHERYQQQTVQNPFEGQHARRLMGSSVQWLRFRSGAPPQFAELSNPVAQVVQQHEPYYQRNQHQIALPHQAH